MEDHFSVLVGREFGSFQLLWRFCTIHLKHVAEFPTQKKHTIKTRQLTRQAPSHRNGKQKFCKGAIPWDREALFIILSLGSQTQIFCQEHT